MINQFLKCFSNLKVCGLWSTLRIRFENVFLFVYSQKIILPNLIIITVIFFINNLDPLKQYSIFNVYNSSEVCTRGRGQQVSFPAPPEKYWQPLNRQKRIHKLNSIQGGGGRKISFTYNTIIKHSL